MEKKVDEIPHEEKGNIVEEEVDELLKVMRDSRTRETLYKPSSSGNTGSCKGCGPDMQENKSPLPLASLDSLESTNAEPEAKKKPMFSISLSQEEIEEDIFLLTGLKPTKKPKKRAEEAQKQLDKLFPGMGFALETPDASNIVSRGTSPPPSALSSDVGVERKSDSRGK